MAEKNRFGDELVHLARLSLAGRRQDVLLYVKRLIRKTREIMPEISDQLSDLLVESPSIQSPLRGGQIATIPVDNDSRLQLVRFEYPVDLNIEPILTESLSYQLNQLINERKHLKELLRAGLSATRSLLLTGPPGVGKSLTARWIARSLDRPLLTLDLSAVMSSFLGRTGNNLRHVLDYAKSIECVLLLDEFDAIAKRRDDLGEVGELKRLVTVLLQEIDDWPSSGILIAATNHPNLLDPAVWRRFEMVLEFTMPNNQFTVQAIEKFIGEDGAKTSQMAHLLSNVLTNVSFSEIERVINQLRREAILNKKEIEDVVTSYLIKCLSALSKTEKRKIAVGLVENGYSQRFVQQITGVSRDTIRKGLNGETKV